MKTILCVIGIIVVFVLSGCDEVSKEKYATITGKPISVAIASGDSCGVIAVVLEVNYQQVLCKSSWLGNIKIAEASAIIQSEIAKGNEGQVELNGYYTKEGFIIEHVKVNGISVDF